MKTLYTFLILVFTWSYALAQLPLVEFDNYTPKWYFFVKDSLFKPGSNPNINAYNSVSVSGNVPAFHQNFTYGLFNNFSRDNDYQDGGILYKVNVENGEIVWKSILNTNHGEDYLALSNLFVGADSSIYLLGRRRTNIKPEDNQWRGVGYAQDILFEIDPNEGKVKQKMYNKNDSVGIYQFLFGPHSHFLINQFQKLKRSRINNDLSFHIDDFNQNSGEFELTQKLPIKINMDISLLDRTRYHFANTHHQDHLISLHYMTSKDVILAPDECYLQFYNLDEDTFKLNKTIDIQKYFKKLPPPLPNTDLFFGITSKEGDIFFAKTWHDPSAFQYIKYWMLWLDKDGNEKTYVDEPVITGTNHLYANIIPFYIDNYGVYMNASPSITGKEGADIVRLQTDGKFEVLGSLTTGDTKRMSGFRVNMDEAGNIGFMMVWDNQYSTFMGFHISDFGINLSTDENENIKPSPLMILSPNPAIDRVHLDIKDQQYHRGMAYIYDKNGRLMFHQKTAHGEEIEVGKLPSGTYIVHYNPDNRPDYFLTAKLVKR
ncbi:MAG: T9SS type A sorting domain-containing protein [Saprospiraceae bacterium]